MSLVYTGSASFASFSVHHDARFDAEEPDQSSASSSESPFPGIRRYVKELRRLPWLSAALARAPQCGPFSDRYGAIDKTGQTPETFEGGCIETLGRASIAWPPPSSRSA